MMGQTSLSESRKNPAKISKQYSGRPSPNLSPTLIFCKKLLLLLCVAAALLHSRSPHTLENFEVQARVHSLQDAVAVFLFSSGPLETPKFSPNRISATQ
jgi:hypothetical protein